MKSILPSIWYEYLAVVEFDWWENGFLSLCEKCVCLLYSLRPCAYFRLRCDKMQVLRQQRRTDTGVKDQFPLGRHFIVCGVATRHQFGIEWKVKNVKIWIFMMNDAELMGMKYNWQYSLRMFKLAWNRIVTETLKKKNPTFWENEEEPSCDASNSDNFYLCNIFSIIFIVDIRWEHSFWTHRTDR